MAHHHPYVRRRHHQRGLTLLELMIVISVVMMVMGLGVAGLDRMSSVQLRTQTNKLAAAIRHAYNRSSAHGLYVRMVFDLDAEQYWAEASAVPMFLPSKKLEEGDEADKEQELEEEKDGKPLKRRAKYQRDGVIPLVKLIRGIGIDGVLTTSQKDVFEHGKAYIHFFPNGFVEPALIYMTDGDGTYYTLIISPMTGKVTRKVGKVDADREFGEPDKIEEEGQ